MIPLLVLHYNCHHALNLTFIIAFILQEGKGFASSVVNEEESRDGIFNFVFLFLCFSFALQLSSLLPTWLPLLLSFCTCEEHVSLVGNVGFTSSVVNEEELRDGIFNFVFLFLCFSFALQLSSLLPIWLSFFHFAHVRNMFH